MRTRVHVDNSVFGPTSAVSRFHGLHQLFVQRFTHFTVAEHLSYIHNIVVDLKCESDIII